MLLLYGGRSTATIAVQLGFACRFIHNQMYFFEYDSVELIQYGLWVHIDTPL